MTVKVARTAGFCYGVRRAVELAERTAAREPVYLLGHITHNDHVIRRLEGMGAKVISAPEEAPEGAPVLIRAHGEPDGVYRTLAARGCRVLDATCPNVAHIHDIVRDAEARGRVPVVVGEADHPEILGILGCTRHGIVVSGWESLEQIIQKTPGFSGQPLTFVSQTTAILANWEKIVENAKKCVQTRNFLIQYVMLRPGANQKRWNWPVNAAR